MSYLHLLRLAAPETVLVITGLVVLGIDLLGVRDLNRQHRVGILLMIACAGCLASIVWMVALPQHASLSGGMLVVDSLRDAVKIGLLVLTILTLLLSADEQLIVHLGEYVAIVLMATVGMLFLVSSEDILMIFVSLELTSLSLYILTGYSKHSLVSAEAALKYFLFGGMSAAFTLFGLSLVYGLSGSTNLGQIAASIRGPSLDPLWLAALVMVAVGFAFKVAAAPFHLWAPDVYQGACLPSAAFIASASKVAGFFIFARLMTLGFSGAEGSAAWDGFHPGWVVVVAVMSAGSMFLGNLAALAQSSVRRLLAYSAIAHAGYMLVGVVSSRQQGLAALVYYALTYGVTTLGAFGVVSVVQTQTGGDHITNFAGLSRRSPLLSFFMLIFLLSLAGIPPLAGFFGKFYVFAAALKLGPDMELLWLVVLALILSAVSLYYYLQVLKHIYVLSPPDNSAHIHVPTKTLFVLALAAILVVALGCFPNLLVSVLEVAVHEST